MLKDEINLRCFTCRISPVDVSSFWGECVSSSMHVKVHAERSSCMQYEKRLCCLLFFSFGISSNRFLRSKVVLLLHSGPWIIQKHCTNAPRQRDDDVPRRVGPPDDATPLRFCSTTCLFIVAPTIRIGW